MAINDGRVVSNFILQALNKKNITINGDGNQTRSFQYIDDLIKGLIKMMSSEINFFIGPVNLENPNEISINELASKIISLTNQLKKLFLMIYSRDDPRRRKPNIELANNKLNWTPKFNLDIGLLNTIQYFKKIT